MGFERPLIGFGHIGFVIPPAGEVNANEFKGQRPAGLMVLVLVALALLLIVATSPGFFTPHTTGMFVKGLPTEFGTTAAHARGFRIATLDDHGRQTVKLCHLLSTLETTSVSAKGDEEPGHQSRAGGGKAAENSRVGVLVHGLFNDRFELGNGLMQRFEQARQGADE